MKKSTMNTGKSIVLLLAIALAQSCTSDNDAQPEIADDPTVLDCNHFSDNANVVLEDNPDAAVDYMINCEVLIQDDVTIEPGVTIAFGKDAGFRIQGDGSLAAEGTATAPITLTATTQEKGWWGGVLYATSSTLNKISHTTIAYAGSGSIGDTDDVRHGALTVEAAASLELTNSTIQHSAETGLSVAGSTDSDQQAEQAYLITLSGNTYTNNRTPAHIPLSLVGNLNNGDTYSGNEVDMVLIAGQLQGMTVTMPKLEVPYQANSTLAIRFGKSDSKSHLIIEPGVEIAMGDGYSIDVYGGANHLTAEGTAADPIIIRGVDSTPGSWGSIRYRPKRPADNSTGQIDNSIAHARISHGSAGSGTNDGVVSLQHTRTPLRVSLNDVHFADYTGTGCPVVVRRPGPDGLDWNKLTASNLTDDIGRLPRCVSLR